MKRLLLVFCAVLLAGCIGSTATWTISGDDVSSHTMIYAAGPLTDTDAMILASLACDWTQGGKVIHRGGNIEFPPGDWDMEVVLDDTYLVNVDGKDLRTGKIYNAVINEENHVVECHYAIVN